MKKGILEKMEKVSYYAHCLEYDKLQLEKLEYKSLLKNEYVNVHISWVSDNIDLESDNIDLERIPVQTFIDFAKPFLKKRIDQTESEVENLLK